MTYLDTPQAPQPKDLPHYLVGAASPLWAYFAGAAASGVAFWWMTRWTQPANLEALFAAAMPAVKPVFDPEPMEAFAAAPPAIVEAVAELAVEAAPPLPPVADVEPELAAASAAPAEPEPVIEAAPVPEPAPDSDIAPSPALEAVEPEPASVPRPRARKATAGEG